MVLSEAFVGCGRSGVEDIAMSNTEHIAAPWQPEHTLSVAEAIKEAMDDPIPTGHTQYASRVETPRDLPAPQPHLPLRKSSAANRMQSRKGSIPKPIFTPAQKKERENIRVARGFNPSPVLPSPIVNDVTASSEHAFAGREPRRPKNAVGLLETQQPILQYAEQPPQRATTTDSYNGGRPPSSPMYPQSVDTGSPVKKSKTGTYPGLGWPDGARYMFERTLHHGLRRAAEMRESAVTYDELGFLGALADRIADVQERMGRLPATDLSAGALDEAVVEIAKLRHSHSRSLDR